MERRFARREEHFFTSPAAGPMPAASCFTSG
jgi:hypothetical protein